MALEIGHSPVFISVVAAGMRALGLEPRTYGLKGRCSTS